jgi:hypothetical protein
LFDTINRATYLQILLHEGSVAILAAHRVMQTPLMVVLLSNVQTTVAQRTLHGRVLTVYHDMVVDIDAVIDPVASSLAIRALDYKFVQHILHNLGHRPDVSVLDDEAAGRARLAASGLGSPGMVEAVAAEVVLAGQLDGPVEGRVTDEADEVAVGRGDVFERGEFGGHFDDAAAATLRRG